MSRDGDRRTDRHLQPSSMLKVLEALPYAVSWATLPDGELQYCNREFERLFGHGKAHFQTVDRFIESAYLYEQQRVAARKQWLGFEVLTHPQKTGPT
ncbi:PAS domain-containing protein [Pectobacterium betavasculorum]|uniref:PAS domain-containing protein n=1 Tax=Pectobacterium betavasculorum TaxID=55207 RepID=UPI00313DA1F3